jgi:hypothetical protein
VRNEEMRKEGQDPYGEKCENNASMENGPACTFATSGSGEYSGYCPAPKNYMSLCIKPFRIKYDEAAPGAS